MHVFDFESTVASVWARILMISSFPLPPSGHYGPVSTHRIINITLKCLQEPFTRFNLFLFLTLFFKEKQQISNHSPQGYLYAQTDINWVINFANELCFRAIKEDHFDDSWARWAGLMVACLNPQNLLKTAAKSQVHWPTVNFSMNSVFWGCWLKPLFI